MKTWYKSKTIWINIATIAAVTFAEKLAEIIEPYIEISILAVINLVLRLVTKDKVSLK